MGADSSIRGTGGWKWVLVGRYEVLVGHDACWWLAMCVRGSVWGVAGSKQVAGARKRVLVGQEAALVGLTWCWGSGGGAGEYGGSKTGGGGLRRWLGVQM